MRFIDFSISGGFPLTQDRLDFMQQAYLDPIRALASTAQNGFSSPVAAFGGIVSSVVGSDTIVSAGWFYYNGDFTKFPGQTIPTPGGSDVLYMQINVTNDNLVYNDGSSNPVLVESTGSLVVMAGGTPATADYFPLSWIMPYGKALMAKNSASGQLIVGTSAANGTITGTVNWKRNDLTGMLYLKGLLNIADPHAANFPAGASIAGIDLGNLGAGVSPSNRTVFVGLIGDPAGGLPFFEGGAPRLRRYTAFDVAYTEDIWLDRISLWVKSDGHLYGDFLKTDPGAGPYLVEFNAAVPVW